MGVNEFIGRIVIHYDREIGVDAAKDYTDYLKQYSDRQRDQLWNHVMRHCPRFPRIADIHLAAVELMFISDTPIDTYTQHTWTSTDCPACQGEGRVRVVWRFTLDDNGNEVKQLVLAVPLSSEISGSYILGKGEYAYFYPCECMAGSAKSIPQGKLHDWSKGVMKWNSRTSKQPPLLKGDRSNEHGNEQSHGDSPKQQ